MESLPDNSQPVEHTTSTRSSSRIGRKSQWEVVSKENESKLNDFSSTKEEMQQQPISAHFPGDFLPNNNRGFDSNLHDHIESNIIKRKRSRSFKSSTKKRIRVDAAASLLSGLNERAHRRSLVKDANSVNQRIVLPMALPWKQDAVPLTKSIPFDIDEMPDVLAADENSHVPLGSPKACPVARRSFDPGSIDLTFITKCTDETNAGCLSKGGIVSLHLRDVHPGEIALKSFELESRLKRSIQGLGDAVTQRKELSVRINSTSSKATILPSNLANYLEARLPAEVQDGRFLSMKRAKVIAKRLGTYDCRHGLPPTNPTGKNANRVTVGRTRRMWTSKCPPDTPQRVFFTSLLTGKKLDSGAQRRPRDIRLAIKLDGEYFCYKESLNSSPRTETSSWGTKQYIRRKKQCVVIPSNYIKTVLRQGSNDEKDLDSPQVNQNGKQTFHEPRLECLPDNTGMISVTCGVPGNINISSLHDALNSAARQKSLYCTVCWATGSSQLGDVQACSGCGLLAHLQCCMDSGELSRIPRGGSLSPEWTCALCCSGRKQIPNDAHDLADRATENGVASRPPNLLAGVFQKELPTDMPKLEGAVVEQQKCALCPYSGGAMSQISVGNTRQWVHEVCRIWSDDLVSDSGLSPNAPRSTVCALCGTDEGTRFDQHALQRMKPLVKCAASSCLVQFHPMCALLASKLQNHPLPFSKVKNDEAKADIQERLLQDRGLMKDFTLNTMHYEASGTLARNKHSKIPNRIPVCFCSFHHPSRDASLYGLYLGGTNIDEEVVRVPSLPRTV